MPVLESAAAIDLGAAVAKLVLKFWVHDPQIAAGTATDIVDLLAGSSDRKTKKALRRTLDRMADEIDSALEPFYDSEFGGIKENERLAALEAVKSTIDL